MTEKIINDNNKRSLAERSPPTIKNESISKEEPLLSFNFLNNKNLQKESPSNDYIAKKGFRAKDSSDSLKNSINFSKAQTKSREIDKRYDIYGNLIVHGGKQRISFIDRLTKNNFVEVIKIENYKEYNKMEDITPSSGNGCCLII